MAGAVKHMQRSHAGMNKNYQQYRKSTFRSGGKVNQRLIRQAVRESLLARLFGVFKRQDR